MFYSYGRWDALDVITFGLVHPAQELAGIGGETLDVTSLSLGIKCIKGKTALAATTQTCYDNKLAAWDFQVNILQVVNPGAFYLYAILHCFVYRLLFTVY